jgi:hypothetical protein
LKLPPHIFFTGVPGSHWSAIAQDIGCIPGINTSDYAANREYTASTYSGHKGAYFGPGMEFEDKLDTDYIDAAWSEPGGCKIVKSHEWPSKLNTISDMFPNDWIMLVYRPDMSSFAWWHEVGGFKGIKYPNYDHYKNSSGMLAAITQQNFAILEFAREKDLTWNHYSSQWLQDNFDHGVAIKQQPADILVSIYKQ